MLHIFVYNETILFKRVISSNHIVQKSYLYHKSEDSFFYLPKSMTTLFLKQFKPWRYASILLHEDNGGALRSKAKIWSINSWQRYANNHSLTPKWMIYTWATKYLCYLSLLKVTFPWFKVFLLCLLIQYFDGIIKRFDL